MLNRAYISIVAFALLTQVGSAQPAPKPAAIAHDFKGIRLGASLPELRSAPLPQAWEARMGVHLICSNEPVPANHVTPLFHLSADERAAGIVRCQYFGNWDGGTTYDRRLNKVMGLSMGGGDYVAYDYNFGFIPDPTDGVLRLYAIWLETSLDALPDVDSALRSKFGKPTQSSLSPVQNGFGAAFPQTTSVWSNPVSSVTMQSPFERIDRMLVLYDLKRLSAQAVRDVERARAAKPNRM